MLINKRFNSIPTLSLWVSLCESDVFASTWALSAAISSLYTARMFLIVRS